MRNFARALKEAWRHWPALAVALCCSLGVAALWGGNIAALVPDHRDHAQRPVAAAVEPAAAGHGPGTARRATGRNPPARTANRRRCGRRRARNRCSCSSACSRRASRSTAPASSGLAALQPFFDRYLPKTPFHTVVFLVTLVGVATALKQCSCSATRCSCRTCRRASPATSAAGFSTRRSRSIGPGSTGRASAALRPTSRTRPTCWPSGITNFYGGAVTEPLRILACLWRRLVHLLAADAGVADFRPAGRVSDSVSQPPNPRAVAAHSRSLDGLPPRDARSVQLAAHRAGQHDGRLRAKAIPRIDRTRSARFRLQGDVLQLADQPRDRVARHGHAVHGRDRFRLSGDQPGDAASSASRCPTSR